MVGFYGGQPLEYAAINEQGTEAVPASTGEVLGAAFGQGLSANLFPRMMRSQGRFAAETGVLAVDEFGRPVMGEPDPVIDPETANSQYGIKGVLSFDKPVPQGVARDLHDHKQAEIEREDAIARRESGLLTGGAARFTANIAAGLLDPVNLAAGFIPFVGEERAAALLGRGALETMAAGERAGVRALTGAGQGAAAMTALQPLEFGLSRGEREDYTMADALRSIAMGAVLGGGLHTVGGAVADRVTGRYRNPLTQTLEDAGPETREALLQGSLAQQIEGRPVDVAPALDALAPEAAPRAADAAPGVVPVEPALTDTRAAISVEDVIAATRREPPDVAQARRIGDEAMARPSDELQAIRQQIVDLEQQAAHVQSEAAPAAPPAPQPEIIGRQELLRDFTDAKGLSDVAAASDNLAARVQTALQEGRTVTLYVDNKAVPIKNVARGMMQDEAGQRWGTMRIAADNTGRDRVEISPPPAQRATAKPRPAEAPSESAPVDPGEARAAAVERAASCIMRGVA